MAIIDRAVDEPEENCRRRSAMTTKLAPASFDPAMNAVVVTESERVVAGGAYLNVYEAYDDSDTGGCRPPMANRGTSVVAPPDDGEELPPWEVVSLALTQAHIWIGRRTGGILRTPADFVLIESRYFHDAELWMLGATAMPFPLLNDLSQGSTERAWAALTDEDGAAGGLLLLAGSPPEAALWVDSSSLGGVPTAVDVARSARRVWLLTGSTVATFIEPD
jgi:hypothetical protein